jgi:hypothetical protein
MNDSRSAKPLGMLNLGNLTDSEFMWAEKAD